jgi:hypothetical protein
MAVVISITARGKMILVIVDFDYKLLKKKYATMAE